MRARYTPENQMSLDLNYDFDITEENVFLNGNIQNIGSMLPYLYLDQHEDVALAEKRFEQGKGYMFTNGTGTGKTLVGCGIIYRFYIQNKKDILIVVPTDQKCIDWIEESKNVGLEIYQLKGINDTGIDITITTYANFYQNNALNLRNFDLVIYDESHYLGQNQNGKETSYFDKHKFITNVPSKAREKAQDLYRYYKPNYDGSSKYYEFEKIYNEKCQEVVNKLVNKTKVVFFSATPFAYHKSIKYSDGCLIDIEEKIEIKKNNYTGYNEPSGFDEFLTTNFGYRMLYNKLTIPESGVDVNLLERQFFEKMKEKGIISTRTLNLDKDYSRQFITIDSDLGEFINSGIELFYESSFMKTFPILVSKFGKKYNYIYVNQLLECIKAKEIIKRIQQHLDLNRKVLIFHSYNHAAIDHPFHYNISKLLTKEEQFSIPRLEREIKLFEELYPEYYNLKLNNLQNTRETILQKFPNAKEFNGTVNKKLRSQYLKDFNNDYGNTNILLVQEKAGKEGLSAHDKTGKFQRVLIQLGLPTAPTTAIQIEGRTYRQGSMTDAPYEYITLQTSFERIAFGTKIAERSRTVENLAMGNLARDLETAFKEGYLNSNYEPPSLEQGIGGKESDKFSYIISDFDKAISYYYSRGKRNSKNKSKEGSDYFATPEPLGYKMVQWLNPQTNELGLEPSAGHGAIARWFPNDCVNHYIEESISLTGELCINATGTVKIAKFEEHSVINKYDFVAMNPPFGTSGKTAMEHIYKVLIKHTHRFTAKVICIVPAGPTMNKRIESFLNSKEGEPFYIKTEIKLPSCTFERAGTQVSTKIIYFVKSMHSKKPTYYIDLSYIQTIKEFFEEIRDMEI
jgi:hypothetical protein